MDYVRHPKFSHADLHEKKVAYCQRGDSIEHHFQVGKVRDDGFHELRVMKQVSIPLHGSEKRLTSALQVIELGQDAVDKIEVPDDGSYLNRMGYDFAIILDSESSYLTKAQTNLNPIATDA